MLLNSLSQQFVISFSSNFFYSEVVDRWMPVLKRRYLPYNSLEDFINAQITSVNFPGINSSPVSQTIGHYTIQKRPGTAADSTGVNKNITLTIKNTESYIAYFILRQQMDYFLKIGSMARVGELYMPDIVISLLDDGGFETVSYVLRMLTMTSLSDLSLQYSAGIGNFNTFTAGFVYQFYDVYTVDENGRHLVSEPIFPQKDFPQEFLDSDNPKHNGNINIISTKKNLRELARNAKGFHSVSKNPNPGELST